MILKINEKEIIKAKYFRKFNVVTKSLKDLRSKWLEIGSLWGFGNIWVIGKLGMIAVGIDGFARKKKFF